MFKADIILLGQFVLITARSFTMKCILCAKEIHGEKVKWLNESSPLCEKCAAITSEQTETNYEPAYSDSEQNRCNDTDSCLYYLDIWHVFF